MEQNKLKKELLEFLKALENINCRYQIKWNAGGDDRYIGFYIDGEHLEDDWDDPFTLALLGKLVRTLQLPEVGEVSDNGIGTFVLDENDEVYLVFTKESGYVDSRYKEPLNPPLVILENNRLIGQFLGKRNQAEPKFHINIEKKHIDVWNLDKGQGWGINEKQKKIRDLIGNRLIDIIRQFGFDDEKKSSYSFEVLLKKDVYTPEFGCAELCTTYMEKWIEDNNIPNTKIKLFD